MNKKVTISIAIVFLIIILVIFLVKYWPKPPIDYVDNRYPNAAPVILEDYSDFYCEFCRKAMPVMEELKKEYGNNLEVQFKHYIIHGSPSLLVAQASECARDQGKFEEFKGSIMARDNLVTADAMQNIAVDLGMDTAAFSGCLDSGEKDIVIRYDTQQGKIKGVSATPTFVINNNVVIVGLRTQAEFEKAIDSVLRQE